MQLKYVGNNKNKYFLTKNYCLMKLIFKFLNLVFLFLLIFSLQNCSKESNDENYKNGIRQSGYLSDLENGGIYNNPYAGEGYNEYEENQFIKVSDESISTFSIDADGGSYSNVRRYLNNNKLPPIDAVRTEEFINYFRYDYPSNNPIHPITLNGEISDCPWQHGNKLVRIGIKGKNIANENLPNTNFVFLIDVSGSMNKENKLGLLKESFILFTNHMRPQDKVAIVTYAGKSGVVLESTSGSKKDKIKTAINSLGAGGSTAGAEGINTAYNIAIDNFIEDGNNRVILATDGDFNVGVSTQEGLVELIEEKRESGVFLSVLGFGTGNYQDGKMEQLANNGNGNYEYIDNIKQGKKVFIDEFSKFFTVAKDVKVQVKFNSNRVDSYRLIGYENRVLENEEFEDDKKDAGEIGAGQEITALYEIVPIGSGFFSREALTIDFRYKLPNEDVSRPMSLEIFDHNINFESASENMRFATTAAGFGLMLRDSKFKGNLNYDNLINWMNTSSSFDPYGNKAEFNSLIIKAKNL